MIEDIEKDTTIKIEGEEYVVLGKIEYVSKNGPNDHYIKVFLNNHFVLIISGDDNLEFGKDLGEISEFNDFGEQAVYDGKDHTLDEHDYQFVYKVLSGDITTLEGECEFWNYVSDDSVVSVGRISKDNSRADVVTRKIMPSDLEII